jgi:hypothetical protein
VKGKHNMNNCNCEEVRNTVVEHAGTAGLAVLTTEFKEKNLVPVCATFDVWYDVWVVVAQKPMTPRMFKDHKHE